MDRRRFVELSAAGVPAVVALSSASCVPQLRRADSFGSPQPLASPQLDTYLLTMDRGLNRLATERVLKPQAAAAQGGHAGVADAQVADANDALARAALRTLFAVGMLGDLPYENQIDGRVQERLWSLAPEIDETTSAMHRHLELRTSSEWADLQVRLQHRRNPAMEIVEQLSNGAEEMGLSRRRRLHTRALITQTSLRLRSQPPEVVVAEYLDQTRRVMESRAMDVMAQRNLAARLGEAAFWNEREAARRETPRGLKTLGWGLAIFAGSAVIVAAGGFIAVFGMTAGAIVMLVGLVQLALSSGRSASQLPDS